jgi:hypothetical protein
MTAALVESGLCDAPAARVLARAPFAHLAVEASGGPHVTPLLFAATADRLWLAISERTVKARVLARRPRVGVLIREGDVSVTIRGEASLLDPLRPADLATHPAEMIRAPFGLPSYTVRNAAELLGFIRDARRVPAGSMPGNLVLVSVRPRSVQLLPDEGPPARGTPGDVAPALRATLKDVPADVAALARTGGVAVLGLLTPDGPLALPAAWEPDRARVKVMAAALADAPREGPAAICIDATDGARPTAKRGVMLRGPGRISPVRSGAATVALTPERVTYWRGFETRTVQD